jgi:hypothetical protein
MRQGCTIGGICEMRAFLLWLVPAVAVGLAVARVSVWVQPHFAPVVLFPLLIGAALGALVCGLLHLARLSDRRLAVIGTVLLAVLAAAAEHAFFYLDYRVAHARKALAAGISEDELSPADFTAYMRAQAASDRLQIPLWIGNAAAMVVAAAGVVIWYMTSRRVGEPLRDSHSRLGETRPPDPEATNLS